MNVRRWLITIIACALIFAGLAYYKTVQIQSAIAEAESFPEPSESVEAVMSESRSVQAVVTTIGEVIAPQTVTLRNELEGRIVAVNFASGDVVKKGQVMVQLDISEETARLRSAKASAKLAESDLKRIEKLRKTQAVSEERLDNARAQFDITRANIQALQATIDKKTLRAPFDAHTGIHNFEVGELLQVNTTVTTLVGLNEFVWVDFSLPLKQANAELGSKVTIQAIDQNNGAMEGEIIARDSVMSANSRNLQYRAKVVNQYNFPPNAVVNVSVPLGQDKSLTTVPATAVNRDGIGEYVYVLDADSNANGYRARRQAVVTGQQNDQTIAITSGLDVGVLVAANGSFKLREGLLVFVKERRASTDAAH